MAAATDLAAAFGRHHGEVRTFDDQVGAGTVVDAASGTSWSFHCTRLADGSRTIAVGTPVSFVVAPGPAGLEALEVTEVGPSA